MTSSTWLVPQQLHVAKVIYRQEDFGGFGPGANETGLLVYELSNGTVKRIRKGGFHYVSTLNISKGRGYWYQAWAPTPLTTGSWCCHYYTENSVPFNARELLNQFGFNVSEPTEFLREIDDVLATSGSFYTYGKGGSLFIVSPARGRAYLAYTG